ncbi:Uncharacterised protein [Pseudomonas aeruginosa]|nr:Uncharacterised protein [Pseudomonas aeruginosa]
MTQGRSIRLFLVDGTPNGLLTAEIMNWTGHVLTGPRSKLAELVQRPECARTGCVLPGRPRPGGQLAYPGVCRRVGRCGPAAQAAQSSRGAGWQGLLGAGLLGHQQGPEPDQGPCEVSGKQTDRHRRQCRPLRTGQRYRPRVQQPAGVRPCRHGLFPGADPYRAAGAGLRLPPESWPSRLRRSPPLLCRWPNSPHVSGWIFPSTA